MKNILVATPSYDNKVSSVYLNSILNYVVGTDINIAYIIADSDSLVTRARNDLFTTFYQNIEDKDFTHILWQDSDIGMTSHGLTKLLSYNLDVVGEACPLKTEPSEFGIPCAVAYVYDQIDYSLFKAEYVGTGILLLSKQVVYDLVEYCELNDQWSWDNYKNKKVYDIFRVGVDQHKIYQSEDWYLCDILRKIGYEIHVDSSATVEHDKYRRDTSFINPESINSHYSTQLQNNDRIKYWTPNDWYGRSGHIIRENK